MQINLVINLGSLLDEMELDEEGNPIPKKKREASVEDMTLDGLLSGAREKYKVEVI